MSKQLSLWGHPSKCGVPKKVLFTIYIYTVKPVLRGHLSDKYKVNLQDRWLLKRGSIHMKCSMTGQAKGDLLMQVTA
jgi:hypothetical protein